jgi:hypothetical protein
VKSPAPEHRLPADILARASPRGEEYAWAFADIPAVIEAGRRADLVNLGGQLQFRLPDGATCECYWIEVVSNRAAPASLRWAERVARAAEAALILFQGLPAPADLIADGRRHFAALEDFAAAGGDLTAAMVFVWYFEAPTDPSNLRS